KGDGTSLGTIVAGKVGSTTAPGGNDFHGFGLTGHTNLAIRTLSATSGTVQASLNGWSVADPRTVVSAISGTTIDTGSALSANQALVQNLYRDFLQRTGSLDELNAWVSLLPSIGQAGVVSGIQRSSEALGHVVDGLYVQYMGRAADSAGETGWVSFLQAGHTEEEVIAGLLGSAEFANRAGQVANICSPDIPDADFLRALYAVVLGRTGSQSEITAWLSQVPGLGRAAVGAPFLQSTESRAGKIGALPHTLLPRTAANAESAAWANSGLDLLTITGSISASGEFAANG